MQLIIISPLLLLPMLRYPKRMTYIGLPVLTIIVTVYTSAILYFYDLTRFVVTKRLIHTKTKHLAIYSQSSNFDELYYSVTHTRLTPWLIGLIFGAFLLDFKTNETKYRIKNDVNRFCPTKPTLFIEFIFSLYILVAGRWFLDFSQWRS